MPSMPINMPEPNLSGDRSPGAAQKLWRMAALLITIIAVCYISVAPQVANDFWLQAKVGELIVTDHAIPKTVLFPFTEIQNAHFNAHEWLPSLLFFGLVQQVGESGLPLAMGMGGLLLFGSMAWLAYRRSDTCLPLALILGLVAVGVENYRHVLRPEFFSLLLMAAYLHLLESARRRSHVGDFLGALLIVVVWANTHGSFILAPIIAGAYAAGLWADSHFGLGKTDRLTEVATPKAFALFALAALACTLINPFGWELLQFVFEFSRTKIAKDAVWEWMSTFDPRIRDMRGLWIGLGCALLTAGMLFWRWKKLSAVDALLFLMFLALALKTNRFLVYLGMVAAYVLPALVPQGWQAPESRTRLYAICTVLSGTVLVLAVKFGNAFGAYPHHSDFNQSLTDGMVLELSDANLKGNVLTSYAYGAELVYRAYPRLRPSIDSRIDSYGDDYFLYTQYLKRDDKLLKDFVARYDVRYMLLTNEDFNLIRNLNSWSENLWSIRAVDRRAVLLERSDLLPPGSVAITK